MRWQIESRTHAGAMPRKGQSSLLLEKSTASEVQTSSDLC